MLIWLENPFLVFVTAICTIGTITSAYGFDVLGIELILIYLAASLISTALALRWQVKGVLVCLLLIAIAITIKLPDVLQGAQYVLFFISSAYSEWFIVPILFAEAEARSGELILFWAALGSIIIYLLTLTICLKRSALFSFIITLPFVLLSLVLVDYLPNPVFLVSLLIIYLGLLVNRVLYPNDSVRRSLSVLPSLALVLLLMGTAYLIALPDNYSRNELITSLDNQIRVNMEIGSRFDLPDTGWPNSSPNNWRFDTQHVDISDAGARVIQDQSLLEVVATQPGTFYLRGYAMLDFDGRTWHMNTNDSHYMVEVFLEGFSDETQEELDRWGDTQGWLSDEAYNEIFGMLNPGESLRIEDRDGIALVTAEREVSSPVIPAIIAKRYSELNPETAPVIATMFIAKTGDQSSLSYYPYYSIENESVGEIVEYGKTDFFIVDNILEIAAALPPDDQDEDPTDYNQWVRNTFDWLDTAGADELRQLAEQAGIDTDASRDVLADQVAQYVSSSARYTLSPAPIPEGEDFTLYFLQNAREGYCIHFATAATQMLRALDVPARPAFGFVVRVSQGDVDQNVVVTDREAHAWVEVYYDDIGWVPLEVTPTSLGSATPARTPHSSTSNAASPGSTQQQTAGSGARASGQQLSIGTVFLVILFCLVAVILFLLIRRYIVDKSRRRSFAQPDTNIAVLCAWQYIYHLDKNIRIPKNIEYLAYRARYSKHRISEDERTAFIHYAADFSKQTNHRLKLPKRLLRYLELY